MVVASGNKLKTCRNPKSLVETRSPGIRIGQWRGEAHFFHFSDDVTVLGSVSNILMLVQLLEQELGGHHRIIQLVDNK